MALTPQSVIDDIRASVPLQSLAGVALRTGRGGRSLMGPCPICGGGPTSSRFEIRCDDNTWVCAVCAEGGDVFALIQKRDGVTFPEAVARLDGDARTPVDPDEAERRRAGRMAREAEQRRKDAERAERERWRLFDTWRSAAPLQGSAAADYLRMRGVAAPPVARLRATPHMPYYHGRQPDPRHPERDMARIVHQGPAMLAAIIGPDGRFAGLHVTWIDLAQRDGKAVILDPDTGERLPTKKVRGAKKGGHIELVRCAAPTHLVLGEGNETTLTPWTAMRRLQRDLAGWAFWAAVDLGNLGGPHADSTPHPVERTALGAPKRIPGPTPDMAGTAIPVPDTVTDLLLLGDGDSDRLLTENALRRAAARYARPGRRIRIAWAPQGQDFNDLMMGGAHD